LTILTGQNDRPDSLGNRNGRVRCSYTSTSSVAETEPSPGVAQQLDVQNDGRATIHRGDPGVDPPTWVCGYDHNEAVQKSSGGRAGQAGAYSDDDLVEARIPGTFVHGEFDIKDDPA
jgi:hypothetical protein